MAFVDRDGIRLHWDEQGEGTPVLLIMGHRFSSRMWYPLLPELAAKHRVVFFDNRGSGQSGTPTQTTVGEMAEDAVAVMDAAGIDQAHIYGASMGGGIAMELAMNNPERVTSLTLGCTAIATPELRKPPIGRLLRWLPFLLIAKLRNNLLYGPACPADARAHDEAVLAQEVVNPVGVRVQAAAVKSYRTSLQAAARLDMPALVLHGTKDFVVPHFLGEEIANTLPNSRLVSFEGAGHSYIVAAKQESNAAVIDFLDEVDRARTTTEAARAS